MTAVPAGGTPWSHGRGWTWLTTSAADVACDAGRARPASRRVAVVGVRCRGRVRARDRRRDGWRSRRSPSSVPHCRAKPSPLVAAWPELPVLAVADPADHAGLRGAVDAYLASGHERSDLMVGAVDADGGRPGRRLARRPTRSDGAGRRGHPDVERRLGAPRHPLDPRASQPVARRRAPPLRTQRPGGVLPARAAAGRARLRRAQPRLAGTRPEHEPRDLHGARAPTSGPPGWRDAAAAFDHLAGSPGVDPDRLAAVGVIHGAEHAVRAAVDDSRVRALVILTGYRPADPAETAYLTSPGGRRALRHEHAPTPCTSAAMRALYEASPSRHSRYVEYAGGAIGYQLFELDHGLEPAIVDWLAEVLRP